jgi:5-methylcytosine-specific restriction enzyme A
MNSWIYGLFWAKQEDKPGDGKRSSQWPAHRAAHLKLFPACAACGRTVGLEVHHIRPFHLHPELELDPNNLLTLCEGGGRNCHLVFGHFYNWKAYNPLVVSDARKYLASLITATKS